MLCNYFEAGWGANMQLILPKQLALQYLLVCEKPLKLSICDCDDDCYDFDWWWWWWLRTVWAKRIHTSLCEVFLEDVSLQFQISFISSRTLVCNCKISFLSSRTWVCNCIFSFFLLELGFAIDNLLALLPERGQTKGSCFLCPMLCFLQLVWSFFWSEMGPKRNKGKMWDGYFPISKEKTKAGSWTKLIGPVGKTWICFPMQSIVSWKCFEKLEDVLRF